MMKWYFTSVRGTLWNVTSSILFFRISFGNWWWFPVKICLDNGQNWKTIKVGSCRFYENVSKMAPKCSSRQTPLLHPNDKVEIWEKDKMWMGLETSFIQCKDGALNGLTGVQRPLISNVLTTQWSRWTFCGIHKSKVVVYYWLV